MATSSLSLSLSLSSAVPSVRTLITAEEKAQFAHAAGLCCYSDATSDTQRIDQLQADRSRM